MRIHWPAKVRKECICGDKFATMETFREHLRVWVQGLRRIEFKRHSDHWTSRTITPMHTFDARVNALNIHQYVLTCQCGWLKRATLPLARHTNDDNSPGRLAVGHIREIVAARLEEEALT